MSKPWASDYFVNRRFAIGRVSGHVSWRRNNGYMGRFGGGWNWKLGFQLGGGTLLLSLLVLEVTLTRKGKS